MRNNVVRRPRPVLTVRKLIGLSAPPSFALRSRGGSADDTDGFASLSSPASDMSRATFSSSDISSTHPPIQRDVETTEQTPKAQVLWFDDRDHSNRRLASVGQRPAR